MMKKAFSYILLIFLAACQWIEPTIKTLKVCQKPTAVSATVNANNSRQYTLSLVGSTTDIIFPISWKQGPYTIGSSATSSINYTFTGDGSFVITAEAVTVCGDKITLTSTITVKTCVLPTEITVTTDSLDVRKFSFGVKTNAPSDIASVTWRTVSKFKDQAYGSLKATDKINYTVNSSEVVSVTATIQTICGQTLTLIQNISADFKVWDKTFGGSGTDELISMVSTSDGGYLLGGFSDSNSSGDKTENSRGNYDFWVVKINANGQKQWDKTYGGVGEDKLTGVVGTPDGGFLLSGQSLSQAGGDKTENSRGGYDFWIVKINANGQKQWDKTFGGNNTDYLGMIIATSDGSFVIGGNSTSNISGDKSENGQGAYDFWVVKINANGQKQWDKTLGGRSDDFLGGLCASSDGGYLLGGSSYSNNSGDKSESSRGNIDYWLVKIDKNGQKQWDKTYGGIEEDNCRGLMATPDGGYLLASASISNSSGEKSENRRGSYDCWIIKTNSSGQKQWDKTYGGPWDDAVVEGGVTLGIDNSFLITGYSSSPVGNEKSEPARGQQDFWLFKVNGSGEKLWDKVFGGSGQEGWPGAKSIANPNGSILLGGSSDSNISGEKSENSRGGKDFWVVKIR